MSTKAVIKDGTETLTARRPEGTIAGEAAMTKPVRGHLRHNISAPALQDMTIPTRTGVRLQGYGVMVAKPGRSSMPA